MKLSFVLVSALVAFVPRGARAQVSGDVSLNISLGAPPGEAIDSTDVFYDELAPYGTWVDDPQAGQVFVPEDADYVPYTNGHWEYTDLGFVWVSNVPFAYVTSHYGRWWYSSAFARWEWVPDTTWAPSWVQWSSAGDDYGWAPMPPQFAIDAGYRAPIAAWHFAPARHLVDADVARYYVPRDRVATIQREARPIQRYGRIGSARVAVGPAPETLRTKGVTLRAQKIEPKQLGRMQASELSAAKTRAQERKPQLEAQNRERIEANPRLRAVARPATGASHATTETPARPEPKAISPKATRPAPKVTEREQAKPTPEAKRPAPPRAEPTPRAEPKAMPEAKRAAPEPKAMPEAKRATPEPKRATPEPKRAMPEAKRATPEAKAMPEAKRATPEPKRTEPKTGKGSDHRGA